ncbi:MAG: tRNA pseudouridine(55) synthase TruB [Hahellaceae bacterium]|nr:tRNA pseudouridine(55) synthase TruB [Hahellaceae bacterium]
MSGVVKPGWRDVHGVLVLDKPKGVSSNQALQKVRRLLSARKGGHTGNLDPLATGVLPLCFGEATKYSHFLLDAEKTYLAEGVFGTLTDSGDCEGVEVRKAEPPEIDSESFASLCHRFVGAGQQVPPMYSALKHQGRPLYELARKGIEIDRPPRDIVIHECQPVSLNLPYFRFRVTCSKGTYVRTLIEDMAQSLGSLAHMTNLRREQSGPFSLQQAVTLEQLESLLSDTPQGVERLMANGVLMPIDSALTEIPTILVNFDQGDSLICGRAVTLGDPRTCGLYRVYRNEDRMFLGVGKVTEPMRLSPFRLISSGLIADNSKVLGRL